MQDFEILANRNLRGFELPGEFRYQHPALVIQQIEDGASSFFVKQRSGSGEFGQGTAAVSHFFL
jgi:hypothetical protein